MKIIQEIILVQLLSLLFLPSDKNIYIGSSLDLKI